MNYCQTCGESSEQVTMGNYRVNSPLMNGEAQWEQVTLCPNCCTELDALGRLGRRV